MKHALLTDEVAIRAAAVELARWACNGTVGRIKGDPVFEEVTEGRQSCWLVNGKRRCYSGCGDLPHWMFWRLVGATRYSAPALREALKWLNRREAWGWKVGVNISRLVGTPGWQRMAGGRIPSPAPGDVVLVGEGGQEHVFDVQGFDGATLESFDYGQFFNPTPTVAGSKAAHGGKRTIRHVEKRGGRWWAWGATPPGRPIIGWLDVVLALRAVQAAGALEPALVPDSFPVG